jgi:type IV secretion system protein VirD4
MARFTVRPPRPVLFLLDEFAALGRLEPMERDGDYSGLWPSALADSTTCTSSKAIYSERVGTFMPIRA